MTRSIINPAGLHTPTGYGYSHIVSAPGEQVFIAGQYGSDESGHIVSDDFADQVERAFANLRTALAAAGLGPADVVRIGTYIVGHDQRKLEVLLKHLGHRAPRPDPHRGRRPGPARHALRDRRGGGAHALTADPLAGRRWRVCPG